MSSGADEFVVLDLAQDPERLADALIADELPPVFLNDVDLESIEDALRLLMQLGIRIGGASIEKDELVEFVERNREFLSSAPARQLFTGSIDSLRADDPELANHLQALLGQIDLVLMGRSDDVDVVSSRLLWLCVALSLQLDAGTLTFPDARAVLARPKHRARMSQRAVHYLLSDYLTARREDDDPRTWYAMVIGECALLADDLTSIKTAIVVLRTSPVPGDGESWADMVARLGGRLDAHGALDEENRLFLSQVKARFGHGYADDDL